VGARPDLPLERAPCTGPVTLASLLQRAQTAQLARWSATHQPCPQRPEAGQLDPGELVDAGTLLALLAIDVPCEEEKAASDDHDGRPDANAGPDVPEEDERDDAGEEDRNRGAAQLEHIARHQNESTGRRWGTQRANRW
jgi:hypothetical protein